MELALNLSWLALSTLLCAGCLLASRRGALRLPLRSALACSLLLAVVLFPAISMTDDLQRASAEIEQTVRHALTAAEHNAEASLETLPFAALLLWLFSLLLALVLVRMADFRRKADRLQPRVPRFRPAAARPPTAMLPSLAV